jgi:exosortase A
VTSREALSTPAVASSWRNAYIVLGCCLVLMVVVHRSTVASMVRTWAEDPLAHGYFVVAAAAYLAWSRRERVESMNPRPAFMALPLLGLLSFLWLLANLTSNTQVQQVCLVIMSVALTWAVLGTAAARALAFPFGLLFFTLPFGERLAPALQVFTAHVALAMLTLSHVQAALDGVVISIADNGWRVTEACGGINYLVASLAVGYWYAGAVYRRWGHRVAFLIASAVVPLAANLFRVYTTILLDHLGATGVVAGMGHYLYGVFVFGIVMSILFITCGRWHEEPSTADGPVFPPEHKAAVVPRPSARRTLLCAAIGMLLVAIGPVSARVIGRPPGLEGTTPSVHRVGGVADVRARAFQKLPTTATAAHSRPNTKTPS